MSSAGESPLTDRKEAVIIVNPVAHNAPKPKSLKAVDEWLREQGWRVQWRETAGRGDAISLAARAADERVPLVFVCGGDGTLSEAANGLAGSETALSVIPAGTVNIWAREAGLLKKPLEAVRLAVLGERRKVDLGRADSRYFLLMAGYGVDAAIAANVSPRVKGRLGATAYVLSALRELFRFRGSAIQMLLDGQAISADVLMLVAGNTRNYAGLVEITPTAKADDGLLDVCVYTGRGMRDLLLHGIRTVVRRHRGSKKVLYRRVKRLEMQWEKPLPVQLDGDPYPESPTLVTVAPAALWVMVPKWFRSPLFSD